MDREAWRAGIHGVAKSQTRLSDWSDLIWMRPDAMVLVFWMLSFKPTFSLSSFTFKRLFSASLLSAIRVGHLHIWGLHDIYFFNSFFLIFCPYNCLMNSIEILIFFYILFFKFNFIFKLYIIVLVLTNIKMNPPQIYMCSPSWTLLPPPSPFHPSGSSQCTSPQHPVSCIEPGLATRFIHDILHVSMPFSQIFPPSPSLTESIRLFYTSVSLLKYTNLLSLEILKI